MASRPRPLAFAGALARASLRAGGELAVDAVRTVERTATPVGSAMVRRTGAVLRDTVARTDVGVGPARLSPAGVAWAREQVAAGLRTLLALPGDPSELLAAADPTTVAKAVLALLGGEEELVELPSHDDQIRRRFRALLDPEAPDVEGLTPALLSITTQLAPDEARILRHLDTVGRLPVVDVELGTRTSRRGPVVAEHLSMAVERSGGDRPDRAPQYVDNLLRLGLVAVDDEAMPGHADHDLISATAAYEDALAAVRAQGGRPRVRHRTLRLTALGEQLLAVALHGAGHDAVDAPALDGPPPLPPAALLPPHS